MVAPLEMISARLFLYSGIACPPRLPPWFSCDVTLIFFGPLRGDAPKGGGVPIQVVLENPIHTIMETVTNEVVAATKGTVVAHTTKELKREKNISLGFEAEQSKENVELGSITFEPSARALSKKENAKLWLFADMEHRANKLGYEEQTWVNLGILESRPAKGGGFDLVLLFERVGMREGVVYGA